MKELQDLLDVSVLAPQELSINSITSTRFGMCLWGEFNKEDRERTIRLLTQAHKRLGKKIRGAKGKKHDALMAHCNRILTREAVLAGVYPGFRRHAINLKEIFLKDMMARWNKGKRPGATMRVGELVGVFRDAIRKQGMEGVKTIG